MSLILDALKKSETEKNVSGQPNATPVAEESIGTIIANQKTLPPKMPNQSKQARITSKSQKVTRWLLLVLVPVFLIMCFGAYQYFFATDPNSLPRPVIPASAPVSKAIPPTDWKHKVDAMLQQGDIKGAQTNLAEWLKQSPNSEDALWLQGYLYEKNGDTAETILSHYKSALNKAPESIILKIQLAHLHMASDRWDEAKHYWESVLVTNPLHPSALFHRALCFEKLGMTKQAIHAYEQYMRIDPNVSADETHRVRFRIRRLQLEGASS